MGEITGFRGCTGGDGCCCCCCCCDDEVRDLLERIKRQEEEGRREQVSISFEEEAFEDETSSSGAKEAGLSKLHWVELSTATIQTGLGIESEFITGRSPSSS